MKASKRVDRFLFDYFKENESYPTLIFLGVDLYHQLMSEACHDPHIFNPLHEPVSKVFGVPFEVDYVNKDRLEAE